MKRGGGGQTMIYLCPGRQCRLLRHEEKSKRKRGTCGGQWWENKVSLVLFSAFKANLKFLCVDLLTSTFLSDVPFF